MSEAENRNTTEVSRRGALAGLAGAAAAGVAALPAGAGGEVDPIYAVIKTHHQAMARESACYREVCRLEEALPKDRRTWYFSAWAESLPQGCTDAPEWIASQQNLKGAHDLRHDAIETLMTVEPTTLAGAIALLEYVGSSEYPDQRGAREPILFGVVDLNDERFPKVVWTFPAQLATTMRRLIGGQS
jgi:hypothetical protein